MVASKKQCPFKNTEAPWESLVASNLAYTCIGVHAPRGASTYGEFEYWMYPWGIAPFSWNVCLAIVFYATATHHYVRFLVPKQVDRRFLSQNVLYSWVFAAITGIFVLALAIINTTAALVSIPIIMVASIVFMFRMQPQYIAAYRVAALHDEDDLRSSL